MKRFEDKVALVTGGNSGIGRATALAFAREGARVVIAARRGDLGQAVVREIKENSGDAIFIKTDITSPLDVENLFKGVIDHYGQLDYAFNNAGVGGPMNRLAKQTMETWDLVINTNLRGVWLCLKQEIQQMLKQGGGAIVNTASTAGISGSPGSAIYSASKHGLLGLTKSAAADYATKNIRINAVCPGPIMTPMLEEGFIERPAMREAYLATVPMGRFGEPEEITGAVLWLCSDEASFMTGYSITIGGGQTITP
ncbi:MAG: SDR family oxidoreductase [Deltaproteobacteria bacterium]|nr:SDR family oxidoreductase [Deltaproteobacteria bacterium]